MRATAEEPTSTVARPRRAIVASAALVAGGLLAACGASGGDEVGRTSTTAPAATAAASSDGTCPDGDAAAEVLGGELERVVPSAGEGSGIDLEYAYEGCEVDTVGFEGVASFERVTVTSGADDRSSFEALDAWAQEEWALDGFEPVDGLGDDAYRDGRSLAVLDGDVMYVAGVLRGDAPPELDLEAPTRALAEALLPVDLTPAPALSELCPMVQPAITSAVGPTTSSSVREGREGRAGLPGGETAYLETVVCSTVQADLTAVVVSVADAGAWDDWVTATANPEYGAAYERTTIGGHDAYTNEVGLWIDDGPAPLRIQLEDVDGTPEELDELRRELAVLVVVGG